MASQRSAEERAMKAKRAARILQCSKGAREARPTLISYEDWVSQGSRHDHNNAFTNIMSYRISLDVLS
jgi:hypothetical protein